eukprot:scaffold67567_cov23-Tisochrysis_lutea.AAC.1
MQVHVPPEVKQQLTEAMTAAGGCGHGCGWCGYVGGLVALGHGQCGTANSNALCCHQYCY